MGILKRGKIKNPRPGEVAFWQRRMTEWVFGGILNLPLKTHPTFSSTSSEPKAPRRSGDLLNNLVNLFLS
jgi:hypothetical protein